MAEEIEYLRGKIFPEFLRCPQGIHRLVLGGGSDVCVYGKVGQERFDLSFGGEEVLTGPHAMETNKPNCEWSSGADGVPVGLDRGVLAVDFL